MKKAGFGLIGCGTWGDVHARTYGASPYAWFVAAADQDERRAVRAAREHGAERHTSNWHDLLEDPEAPEEGLPMIVCYEHHKKLAVCASFKKQEFGSKSMIIPDVRNRQIKDLKKISKKSNKK